MKLDFFGRSRKRYATVGGEDSNAYRPSPWKTPLSYLAGLFAVLFIMACSFTVGRNWKYGAFGDPIDLRIEPKMFKVNSSFMGHPTEAIEAAWDVLLTYNNGFFEHPLITTKLSNFAAFHQLHCLETLWTSWWMVYDANQNGTKLVQDEMPLMMQPIHVSHCMELLRLTLMCRPDLTLEEEFEGRKAVTGFGTVHQCRSWEKLLEFAKKWASSGN